MRHRGAHRPGALAGTDPTSPFFANGTKLFRDKQWVEQPFCERDVAARTELVGSFGDPGASPGLRDRPNRRGRLLTKVRFRRGKLHFRLARRARVVIRVRAGRRLVRRIVTTRRAGRHAIRLRLRRGRPYRLLIEARAGDQGVRVSGRIRVKRRRG